MNTEAKNLTRIAGAAGGTGVAVGADQDWLQIAGIIIAALSTILPILQNGLSYEAMGEFGITGRRYFRKHGDSGNRTHQIHAFEAGSPAIERHLAFRDYMIAHPAEAQVYSALKQRLAKQHPDDIEAYMDGKDAYIKEHEAKAIRWRRGSVFSNAQCHLNTSADSLKAESSKDGKEAAPQDRFKELPHPRNGGASYTSPHNSDDGQSSLGFV